MNIAKKQLHEIVLNQLTLESRVIIEANRAALIARLLDRFKVNRLDEIPITKIPDKFRALFARLKNTSVDSPERQQIAQTLALVNRPRQPGVSLPELPANITGPDAATAQALSRWAGASKVMKVFEFSKQGAVNFFKWLIKHRETWARIKKTYDLRSRSLIQKTIGRFFKTGEDLHTLRSQLRNELVELTNLIGPNRPYQFKRAATRLPQFLKADRVGEGAEAAARNLFIDMTDEQWRILWSKHENFAQGLKDYKNLRPALKDAKDKALNFFKNTTIFATLFAITIATFFQSFWSGKTVEQIAGLIKSVLCKFGFKAFFGENICTLSKIKATNLQNKIKGTTNLDKMTSKQRDKWYKKILKDNEWYQK